MAPFETFQITWYYTLFSSRVLSFIDASANDRIGFDVLEFVFLKFAFGEKAGLLESTEEDSEEKSGI